MKIFLSLKTSLFSIYIHTVAKAKKLKNELSGIHEFYKLAAMWKDVIVFKFLNSVAVFPKGEEKVRKMRLKIITGTNKNVKKY